MKKSTVIRLGIIILWSILLTGLITRVYLKPGVPSTHDGENHLARFANYKVALKEGQFPPRFAPNLYHRLGYPVFNYNYPLANIASVPFSLLKLPYQMIFKIIMTTSLILIVIGLWTWLSQMQYKVTSKIFATAALITSPYIFQTVVFRGSIGEVMALAGLIWLLVWIEQLEPNPPAKDGQKELRERLIFSRRTLWGAVLFVLFFLSHNVTVLFGTPLLVLYAIWKHRLRTPVLSVFWAIVLGIGATLWFWLPALAEQSAVVIGGASLSQQYQAHFATLQQLVSSPVQFGFSYLGSLDSISFALGAAQWSVVFIALALLGYHLKKRSAFEERDTTAVVILLFTLLGILLQLPLSTAIWEVLPLVRYIQFPWRLGMFVALGVALLAAWVNHHQMRWQRVLFVFLLVIQGIVLLRMQPVGYINKERIAYELFDQSTTTTNENLPKDFTLHEFPEWKPEPTIESGGAKLEVLHWTGSSRRYRINVTTPVTLIEPTMYFPGWQTHAHTDVIQPGARLEYINSETIKGRIAYQLEPGSYTVISRFTESTSPRTIGSMTSIITIFLIALQLSSQYLFYGKTRRTH